VLSSSFETLSVGCTPLVSKLHTNKNDAICPAFMKSSINGERLTAYMVLLTLPYTITTWPPFKFAGAGTTLAPLLKFFNKQHLITLRSSVLNLKHEARRLYKQAGRQKDRQAGRLAQFFESFDCTLWKKHLQLNVHLNCVWE